MNAKALSSLEDVSIFVDYPDFVDTVNGKRSPTGTVEQTNILWIKAANLNSQISYLPSRRITRRLSSAEPVCSILKIKTPARAENYLFSLPTDIFLAPKLYQHKNADTIHKKYLNEYGEIRNLADMFNDPSFNSILTLLDGKSVGKDLDKQIANINQRKLEYINANQQYISYLQLLATRRADFVLAFPSIIQANSYLANNTRSYSVQNIETHVSGRVMCNKHPQTEALIAHINEHLVKIYDEQAFFDAATLELNESEHALIRDIINNVIKKEAAAL
ncbi:hypothetical protein ACFO4O_08530 [Glaciecola siphonariae]|uniref:Solute-binding protein family 3/N-terminal domain-containing protein n=1 Tax=Glaciecola siphonariae TaxID=521012 RepID=A0ABV9LW59_9ALTE